jgi:hypothetical protein
MEFFDAILGACSLAIFGYAGHLTFHNLLFVDYQSSRHADRAASPRHASPTRGISGVCRTHHLGVAVLFTITFAVSCSMMELLVFEVETRPQTRAHHLPTGVA